MAFENRNLSIMAYDNGTTLWLYKSTHDTLDTMCSQGYFDKVAHMMTNGDRLMLSEVGAARDVFVLFADIDVVTLGRLS